VSLSALDGRQGRARTRPAVRRSCLGEKDRLGPSKTPQHTPSSHTAHRSPSGPPCHKRTQHKRRLTTKVRSNQWSAAAPAIPASPCARPVVQAAAPRRKCSSSSSLWPFRQRNRYRRRRSHPKTPRFGSDGHLEFDFVHERHMQGRVHSPSMEDDRAGDRNAMAVEMPLTLLRCNRSARSSTRTLPDARHDERARSHRSPGQYTVGAAPSLTTSDPAPCATDMRC
jgi:hypothetical protein